MDIAQLLMNGFPKLASADISDAGRQDVKIMDIGIKPLHYRMKAAGPAYTVDTPKGSFLSIQIAITKAPPGSIIVVNAHEDMSVGHMGDLMALACQVRGIAGLVIDGAVRDVVDIIDMGFPVFARGATPHGNAKQLGSVNQSIQCGGIEVHPGDMIFADATGVVAFAASKAQAIYDKAVMIANAELGFVQQLNEGKTLLQIPEFLKLHGIDPQILKEQGVDLGSK